MDQTLNFRIIEEDQKGADKNGMYMSLALTYKISVLGAYALKSLYAYMYMLQPPRPLRNDPGFIQYINRNSHASKRLLMYSYLFGLEV